ncbi:hypothetical protein Ddye_013719 [Dipteronia dyeriana]|uniref:Uncharacterized protein n=1 Tax=Dipteronia dyeriana TaxID=168575 RepID=A0AAE0CKG1_9ROSI|nr:hypothetical protein Ddye_013719 [Dipteronia dyeriana]
MLMPSFWNNVVFALKIVGPFISVFRLVDGEWKPPMGYIYEDVESRCKIDMELSKYKRAEGLFGSPMAIRMKGKKSSVHLGVDEIGAFLNIKRRNRLAQSRLNDLVFIKYNRALRCRYYLRDTIDPIYLNEIDDNNEWLTERLDDENEGDDELVFMEEDNLTWNDVVTAVRVGQSSYRFRSREASSSRVPQQSQVRSSLRLVDEEESEKDTEWEDKGNQFQESDLQEGIGGDDDLILISMNELVIL